MRTFLLTLIFMASSNIYAMDSCIELPIVNEVEVEFKGEITEVSTNLSYQNCPQSVLIKDRFIFHITQIIDHRGELMCVYNRHSVSFMCKP